jgi:Uma2 family endonuclease
MTLAPERLREPSPRTKRWTVADYQRLADLGFLPGRYELIEGEILEKMPPNPPHIFALILLAAWLQEVFGKHSVRSQVPLRLPDPKHQPEPDAAVTREPASAYATRLPEPADLLLVVEVSDSTLEYDTGRKALLYAQAGIIEYWALDLNGRRMVVHRQPTQNGYSSVVSYAEQESVSPLARPEAAVGISQLLPEPEETENV